MSKLSRQQAVMQLMHLIKQPKHVAENLLPDREILTVSDVETAAAKYREDKMANQVEGPQKPHWLHR
jgi:hypothetical protein